MNDSELIERAIKALEHSYAPYSNFHVGSAVLCKNGRVFSGCNVENASYGACNCAERTAIFKAISEGCVDFDKIAIVSDGDDFPYPCGICRQVMSEFSPDLKVIVASKKGKKMVKSLKELLPYAFALKDE